MTIETLLRNYTKFNVWANTEIVHWLRSKPLELMESEMPSSFPTIKATIVHIWSAEDIWLQRLKMVSPLVFLFNNFKGTTLEAFDGLLRCSTDFDAYVASMSDAALEESCEFTLLNGTTDAQLRSTMIHHCMNHSTYHRGQIVTMARSLGITDPPGTDYIKYARLHS